MSNAPEFGPETAASIKRTRLEQAVVLRDCPATRVPDGDTLVIEADTEVTILQSDETAFTVQVPVLGAVCRIAGADADALGKRISGHAVDVSPAPAATGSLDRQIDAQLRRVVDPELPVNIVDLGLVYDTRITELDVGSYRVEIDMTLTTQACGMGALMSEQARELLLDLPRVIEVEVDIVWEPRWSPARISPDGRRKLGIA